MANLAKSCSNLSKNHQLGQKFAKLVKNDQLGQKLVKLVKKLTNLVTLVKGWLGWSKMTKLLNLSPN